MLTTLCLALPLLAQDPAPALDTALEPAVLEALHAVAADAFERLDVPSLSVAVVRGDVLVFAEAYGHANLEHEVLAAPDTVYRIASVTKQFAAALVLRAVERGELSLDTPVGEVLDGLPEAWRPIPVRLLLDHTSGIPSYTDDPIWPFRTREELDLEKLLEWVGDEPLAFEPGTDWAYNNTAYWLVGEVLDEATGKSFRRLVQRELAEPLGLDSLRVDRAVDLVPHRAAGYKQILGKPLNADYVAMSQPGAAGALRCTAPDLARWGRALEAGEVVSWASLVAMATPTELPDGRTTGYGLGLVVGDLGGRTRLAHGGGIQGFSSFLGVYPDDDLAIAVLANREGVDCGSVERALASELLGLRPSPPLDLELDPDAARACTGRWRFVGTEGEVRLDEDGEHLVVDRAANGEYRLLHRGDLVFGAEFDPEFRLRFEVVDGVVRYAWIRQNGTTLRGVRAAADDDDDDEGG